MAKRRQRESSQNDGFGQKILTTLLDEFSQLKKDVLFFDEYEEYEKERADEEEKYRRNIEKKLDDIEEILRELQKAYYTLIGKEGAEKFSFNVNSDRIDSIDASTRTDINQTVKKDGKED